MPRRHLSRASDALEAALSQATVTRFVEIDRGTLARLPSIVRELSHAGACRIVADENTMRAAGARVLDLLRAARIGCAVPNVLREMPRVKPRVETAREIASQIGATHQLPIAVGSGVVNDIVKCAAQFAGVPYVSVPTAASMDGYAAPGAAMLDEGFKRSLSCRAPVAIVADLDVIAAAPARMTAWGYGDLAGKVVAGADWMLADALGEEPIDTGAFTLVQEPLKDWFSRANRNGSEDGDALRGLVNGLLVSGFAMQAHGTSRPASGCEHQLAHLWEMDGVAVDGEPVSHGACVGVATVAMLALYRWLLAQDVAARASAVLADHRVLRQDVESAVYAEIESAFPVAAVAESAKVEMRAKLDRLRFRRQRLQSLRDSWATLRSRLEATLLTPDAMRRLLTAHDAVCEPCDIAVSTAKLESDIRRARLIRRRYTLLDCLDDLGWLEISARDVFRIGARD
ncbi:MAG TPA: sn-glycerol-1-phosphate dehydrogenase [Casimicrobiaceae bacterium]|nr:sn-glycerol-1-phosphate dehydrogenase [Casimicrobiaceae bacterium]